MGYAKWAVQMGYRPKRAADAAGNKKVGDAFLTTAMFEGLPQESYIGIDVDKSWEQAAKARNSPYIDVADVTATKRMQTFKCGGPAHTAILAEMFYAFFQKVTEAAGTPFIKNYAFQLASLVNIDLGTTTSAAEFPHTIDFVIDHPFLTSGSDDKDLALLSAVPTSLTLKMQNGVLWWEGDFVAFGSNLVNFNWAGTLNKDWNTTAGKNLINTMFFSIGASDGTSQVIYPIEEGWTATFNNASVMKHFTNAAPQSMEVLAGNPEVTLSFTLPADKASSLQVRNLYETKARRSFQLYGPASTSQAAPAAGDFGMELRGLIMTVPNNAESENQLVTPITVVMRQDATVGSDAPLTVNIADGIDHAW